MTDIIQLIQNFKTFHMELMKAIEETPFENFKQYNKETIERVISEANPDETINSYYEATIKNLTKQTQDLNGTYITRVKYIDRSDNLLKMKCIYLFNLGKISIIKRTQQ